MPLSTPRRKKVFRPWFFSLVSINSSSHPFCIFASSLPHLHYLWYYFMFPSKEESCSHWCVSCIIFKGVSYSVKSFFSQLLWGSFVLHAWLKRRSRRPAVCRLSLTNVLRPITNTQHLFCIQGGKFSSSCKEKYVPTQLVYKFLFSPNQHCKSERDVHCYKFSDVHAQSLFWQQAQPL